MIKKKNKLNPEKDVKRLNICFLHPDLGIGGAERLVVDAAVGLQNEGHCISFYTAYHNKEHCYDETKDGTLKVNVYGNFLPKRIFNKFYVVCAWMRNLYCCYKIVKNGVTDSTIGKRKNIIEDSKDGKNKNDGKNNNDEKKDKKVEYDIIIVDQISVGIPLLQYFTSSKILFYCHYPDQLLTKRTNILKKVYRWPIDKIEEITTGLSDVILVNSKYTKSVFNDTFKTLGKIFNTTVLYPSINFSKYDKKKDDDLDKVWKIFGDEKDMILFISLNRYERKKNIGLAIYSLKAVIEKLNVDPNGVAISKRLKLMIAGGYDATLKENIEYYKELQNITTECKLEYSEYPSMKGQVVFLRSFSTVERTAMFETAIGCLYTPENEHFGIVPVESMYAKCPIIACNSGGPLESVKHEQTGYLCKNVPEEFSEAMLKLIKNPDMVKVMGNVGNKHVLKLFSLKTFTNKLNTIVTKMHLDTDEDKKLEKKKKSRQFMIVFTLLIVFGIYILTKLIW